MNFKGILAALLQGAASGAAQGLGSQAGPKVNWQGVGIVAAFGAIGGLLQVLQSHPAVVAVQPAPPPPPA